MLLALPEMPSAAWGSIEGAAHPLGMTFVEAEQAYNFALYSKHASQVRLLLYTQQDPINPIRRLDLDWRINKSGRVWHCRVPAAVAAEATYYGYQVDGPREPWNGHRFEFDKILLDPYAPAVFFPDGFDRAAALRPGGNAGRAPLGVLRSQTAEFDWSGDRRPHHTHDTIIYELHVRGFTKRTNSGVTPESRGTFAGLIEKIPYLKELGVTAVELMPVFQFDPQEGNYWGYMPISFFALHHAYGRCCELGEEIDELKALVKALHQADIEVILDVVFNHTGEGDERGPTYSFRGIDNSTYYLLEEDRRRYRNDSGTGNVVHAANRYVRAMVLDALRYWVREMHVDGFRFDLASLFTRRDDGSVNTDDPPIIAAIQSDPILADVRLIAEAWDVSAYQLGRDFPGTTWLQWNGRFRDDVRRFVRGDAGMLGPLMRRFYGSDDLFPDTLEDGYHAYQSVNFVTAHDGFSLNDLVSYNSKHNEPNGHGNRDGADENYSWNCGWEGDGAPPEVQRLRQRQARNFFCLLMIANGTPMFVAGDEFLNTQGGNNNPYNQDNETTWLDWDLVERNAGFFRFAKLMIAFRKAHPSLSRSRFWREDVRWFGPSGPVDYGSQTVAFQLAGESQGDNDLCIMVNGSPADVPFQLPAGSEWRRAVDTALESPHDITNEGDEATVVRSAYLVQARSVVVLIR